jgi:hypothetical protein
MSLDWMTRNLWWVASLALALIAVPIMSWGVTQDRQRKTACEKAGGVHFSSRDGSVCLRPESVIRLESK